MIGRRFRVPLPLFFKQKGKKRITLRFFDVLVYPNTLSHHRLAAVVPVSVSKSSVRRHKLKRKIINHVPACTHQGLDVVFLAKSTAATATPAEITKELENTWAIIHP